MPTSYQLLFSLVEHYLNHIMAEMTNYRAQIRTVTAASDRARQRQSMERAAVAHWNSTAIRVHLLAPAGRDVVRYRSAKVLSDNHSRYPRQRARL